MIEAETMDGGYGAGEGEDDGNIRLFRLDPFVQPPILKALFELLPVEELAKCRLVSKLWLNESMSTWRSKATLQFGEEGLLFTRDDGSTRTTSLGEFLDLWEEGDWDSRPFKRFEFRNLDFDTEHVEQQRFLELVGSHVTSLTLVECSFVGRENFRRIIYQAFPKLQFLKIDSCEVDDDNANYDPKKDILVYKEPAFGVHGLKSLDISGRHPDSMMRMLSHFHKLKSLEMCEQDRVFHRNLLEVIRSIREQDRMNLPLKNFGVHFEFKLGQSTVSSIELLKLQDQLNLPLQRLEIQFEKDEDMDGGDLNSRDVIRDILQYHSSTLKWLEIGGEGEDRDGLCKSFPFGVRLENLEELFMPFKFLDSLDYLGTTPNLRSVGLFHASDNLSMAESDKLFSNSSQLEIGDWTLPSLTELIFEFPVSACNLRKLMKWMPNIESFEGVKLDDVKFAMICSNWKNMKILEDRGEELTDEGVIGYEAGGENVPNITKLEKLISFYTRSSRLTSASVHEGFLKLANLKELPLEILEELDDEAKAALEGKDHVK